MGEIYAMREEHGMRNWFAEWLEGFLVTISLKVGTGKGGGRKEADVTGCLKLLLRNSRK
jgi:hypothetical protein